MSSTGGPGASSPDPTVEVLVPDGGRATVATVLETVGGYSAFPYCEQTIAMCGDLSRRLARNAGRDAELQALAFWMRPAELQRLKNAFEDLHTPGTVMVPRGLVFHIPPANVDTIFVYSWILSVLAGNANVIRLPAERSSRHDQLLLTLNEVFADLDGGGGGRHTAVVSYGHEAEVTAALSAACDMRVIWGGDSTVRTIRSVPLSPHATELPFADRSSLAVIKTSAYLDLDDQGRASVAERLYNDAYLFDQLACSSPRALVWVGDEADAGTAEKLLLDDLQETIASKGYRLDTWAAIAKLTYLNRSAADFPVRRARRHSNELAVLEVDQPVDPGPDFCGGGVFWSFGCRELGDLAPIVGRRHQTLAQFGFTAAELTDLAVSLNGQGLDRMVPIGEALTFSRYWDGHDLVREFLRTVYVQPDSRGV